MRTVYSEKHHRHHGNAELHDGQMVPCFEMPRRAQMILDRVRAVGLGDVIAPDAFGVDPIRRVHSDDYVDLLAAAWRDWSALGRTNDALPLVWPVRSMRGDRVPTHIDGRLGYYSLDASAPITAGTWDALQAGADVACTAARLLTHGERSAFALTRPPGHHAAAAAMGGYCYVNNAAVAAQYLVDHGCPRVAIIDVDYHHGNGTQQIFEARGDVLFLSIHADPVTEYPYFLGYADERGVGAGEGATHNYPLAFGTAWAGYAEALNAACGVIRAWGPDAIVVSLGVDTYEHDPISEFKLTKTDYPRIGEALAALGRPTVFVMEGGYAVDDIGVNAVSVLTGFLGQ